MGVCYAFKTALKVQPFFYPRLCNIICRKFPTFFGAPKTVAWARSSGILRCRTMAISQVPAVLVKENIELNEIEGKIFDRLLATLRHFGLPYELRVAGGWVRDKLLGKDCYDIDIALDNMLGSEFVEKVREYLLSVGEEAQGIAIIPSNPDQSKHLETARMRIFDVWIDFVNLRSEEYSNNSRIPTKQKFGTAEEDAYRRDLTINSLFYNINTGLVEDFTKRGISDLKFGKIVTPLPPKETFLDDPLRVLRAIRFGARFGFTLDEGLKEAASCDDVKNALSAKISRERIGTEIDLMIAGNQPVDAMRHVDYLTLFWVIFSLPPKIEPAVLERCDGLCVAYLDAAWKLIPLIGISIFNNEQKRLCLYAALFLPFRKISSKDHKSKKLDDEKLSCPVPYSMKVVYTGWREIFHIFQDPLPLRPPTDSTMEANYRACISVVHYIFRNSLKLKVSDAETVVNVHRAAERFLSLIDRLTSNKENQVTEDAGKKFVDIPLSSRLRVSTGFLLREIKDFWRVAVCISTLLYPVDIDHSEDFLNGRFELERRSRLFSRVESAISKLGVDKVWEVKPLLNGREIMNVLGLKSGGPLVSEWQQKLMEWQLAHPSATAEECVDWMKQTDSKRLKIGL